MHTNSLWSALENGVSVFVRRIRSFGADRIDVRRSGPIREHHRISFPIVEWIDTPMYRPRAVHYCITGIYFELEGVRIVLVVIAKRVYIFKFSLVGTLFVVQTAIASIDSIHRYPKRDPGWRRAITTQRIKMWQRPCDAFGFCNPTHIIGTQTILQEEFHQWYVGTFFKVMTKPSVFLVHALHRPHRPEPLLSNFFMKEFELGPHLTEFIFREIISEDHEPVTFVLRFEFFVMPSTQV